MNKQYIHPYLLFWNLLTLFGGHFLEDILLHFCVNLYTITLVRNSCHFLISLLNLWGIHTMHSNSVGLLTHYIPLSSLLHPCHKSKQANKQWQQKLIKHSRSHLMLYRPLEKERYQWCCPPVDHACYDN